MRRKGASVGWWFMDASVFEKGGGDDDDDKDEEGDEGCVAWAMDSWVLVHGFLSFCFGDIYKYVFTFMHIYTARCPPPPPSAH